PPIHNLVLNSTRVNSCSHLGLGIFEERPVRFKFFLHKMKSLFYFRIVHGLTVVSRYTGATHSLCHESFLHRKKEPISGRTVMPSDCLLKGTAPRLVVGKFTTLTVSSAVLNFLLYL